MMNNLISVLLIAFVLMLESIDGNPIPRTVESNEVMLSFYSLNWNFSFSFFLEKMKNFMNFYEKSNQNICSANNF